MRALYLLAVFLAVAGTAAAQPEASPGPPVVGTWRLIQVGGRVACKLTLTGNPAAAGWEVRAPLACRGAFPILRELASWSYDAQGALALADSEGRKIVAFAGAGTGFETKAPDGKTWRMTAVGPPRALTGRERMTGEFRLSGAGGAICDLSLRADLFGKAGWATPGQCAPPWSAKNISIWTLRGSRLTLMDRTHKPVVVLKSGETGVFVVEDPQAAEKVTLARR